MSELLKKESDTIGEIGNICMGNAATTLSLMVNHVVNITTPSVSLISRSDILESYKDPCIFVQIHYIKGLTGNNVLILQKSDVICLTDLMMGGMGMSSSDELGELQLSALSEAMNQMMGTSATSMATLLGFPVDISTPELNKFDMDNSSLFEKVFDPGEEVFVKVSFQMTIEGLINSSMVQYYPFSFSKEMCDKFIANKEKNDED